MNSLLHASYGPSSANTNTFWLKGSAVTKNAAPVARQVMVTADASTGAPLREIKSSQVKFLLSTQIQNSPPLVPGAGSLRRRQNLNHPGAR